jgi:hypothetical protein
MAIRRDEVVSAQVVLRPARGTLIRGDTRITADNISEFAPAPEAAASAADEFRSKGFQVGPLVGVSFSITGTVASFEKFFGVRLRRAGRGGILFVLEGDYSKLEISDQDLPGHLRKSVQAISFSLPPAYGPTEFHP